MELLAGGELTHGSSRRLVDRGWGLYINKNESLRHLRELAREGAYYPGLALRFTTGGDSAALASNLAGRVDSVYLIRSLDHFMGLCLER